jgi:adenylylsulfate reductase, subunit A
MAFRLPSSECTSTPFARHTLFRQETRWPGYYYRGDYPKLDDSQWHCFTGSEYDAQSGEWRMSKLPVHRIVPGFELLRA